MKVARVHLVLTCKPGTLARGELVFQGGFAVRGIRVYRSNGGRLAVGMPSQPTTVFCDDCGGEAPFVSNFCPHCGEKLPAGARGSHRDLAHPTNATCRQEVEDAVLAEYRALVEEKVAAVRARPYDEGADAYAYRGIRENFPAAC